MSPKDFMKIENIISELEHSEPNVFFPEFELLDHAAFGKGKFARVQDKASAADGFQDCQVEENSL